MTLTKKTTINTSESLSGLSPHCLGKRCSTSRIRSKAETRNMEQIGKDKHNKPGSLQHKEQYATVCALCSVPCALRPVPCVCILIIELLILKNSLIGIFLLQSKITTHKT